MAGKTRFHKQNWASITSDKWILQFICGYRVELDRIPVQKLLPKPILFNATESALIDKEIQTFLDRRIIETVSADADSCGEFISNIFIRYKKSVGIRIILNLKPFNRKYIQKIHF